MSYLDEYRRLQREFPTASWEEVDRIYLKRHRDDAKRLRRELRNPPPTDDAKVGGGGK